MKHHPVVIITSHPAGMAQAVKKLEQDGFQVTVLDSLSANLIDFFGALSQGDDETFTAVSDNADDADVDDSATAPDTDPTEEADVPSDTADSEQASSEKSQEGAEVTDDGKSSESDDIIFTGTINDESVEIHEVDGADIILHPVSVEGTGSKVKFNLSESIEMTLWESKDDASDQISEVDVHLSVPDLEIDATVKIKISELTMNPPVILMGRDWYASFQSNSISKGE